MRLLLASSTLVAYVLNLNTLRVFRRKPMDLVYWVKA
nr:MAG TPA: hypothetical protein [Caudoviricetes sp.]